MAKEPVKKKKKPAAKKVPAKKPPSGTLTERMGEAKTRPYKGTRGGAVIRTEKLRVTGRQYSGDSIKMGQGSKGSVTKPKVVPLNDRPKLLSGPQKEKRGMAIPKGAALPALTAGFFLDPSTFDYKGGGQAGRASGPARDASTNYWEAPKFGPIMMGTSRSLMASGKGNPKTTNKYKPQGGPRINKSIAYMSMAQANYASTALAASEKRKAMGTNAAPPGGPPSGAKAKAKAKSTVWGEARPGAARAMGVSKAAPVDQRKIAKDNKEAKDKKKYDNGAPVLQKKPEKKKGIFGKFKLSARGKRPQTRFQRDM